MRNYASLNKLQMEYKSIMWTDQWVDQGSCKTFHFYWTFKKLCFTKYIYEYVQQLAFNQIKSRLI